MSTQTMSFSINPIIHSNAVTVAVQTVSTDGVIYILPLLIEGLLNLPIKQVSSVGFWSDISSVFHSISTRGCLS